MDPEKDISDSFEPIDLTVSTTPPKYRRIAVRLSRGDMTVRDVAYLFGVTPGAVSRWRRMNYHG